MTIGTLQGLNALGTRFIQTIGIIANFMNKPLTNVVAVEGAPQAVQILADLLSMTWGEFLFGLGLTMILSYKLTTFLLNLIK